MRLEGTVQVYNRCLPTLNIRQKKSERSYLTLGRIPGMSGRNVSILHQTHTDFSGSLYKIHNITKIYQNFIKEGKATISFEAPPIDLRIQQSNPGELNQFIMILRSFIDRSAIPKCPEAYLSDLTAATEKVPPGPTYKLVIRGASELTRYSKSPFPRDLQTLVINKCNTCKFDNKILRLQNLVVLNLEHNRIEYIPEQIDLLPNLKELNLSNNCLGSGNKWKWLNGKCLQKNITHLDLKNNSLTFLPLEIGFFKNLRVLNVNNNQISYLPSLLGKLSKLKELHLMNNKLKYLPGSFQLLKLQIMDISDNRICPSIKIDPVPENKLTPNNPLSLIDIAGKKVLSSRICLSEEILPRDLILYLESASYCICLEPTFPLNPQVFLDFPLRNIATMVTHATRIGGGFPVGVRYCGTKCLLIAAQQSSIRYNM